MSAAALSSTSAEVHTQGMLSTTSGERVRKQPVTLSLRIGPELAARLTKVAAVSGGTRSEVARTWLAQMADAAERAGGVARQRR